VSSGEVRVRLTWVDPVTGDPQERTAPLPVTFGREASNTVCLSSRQLSRAHCRLEAAGGQLVLVDQGSTNGTFVNGQRVSRTALSDGASFQLGAFSFTVQLNPAQLLVRWPDPHSGQPREIVSTLPISFGREVGNTVVLPSPQVSRRHAVIELDAAEMVVRDLNSANGIKLNGRQQRVARIKPGDIVQIGPYLVAVAQPNAAQSTPVASNEQTLVFSELTGQLAPAPPPAPAPASSAAQPRPGGAATAVFPPAIFDQPIVAVRDLASTGLPVQQTSYLAIGGGLGSFIWVDNLVIYGAEPGQIVALGIDAEPYARYRRLCRNSQIPEHERLRSNSDSCPDNIWGWPGYAVREIWADLRHARLGAALKRGWQIFGEPTVAETYTPRAGDVFRSIDVEAERIGWRKIWRYGRVRAIRKTDDGRFVVAYSQSGSGRSGGPDHQLILASFVQIATGYPSIQFLPDLQDYRQRTQDFRSIVNAYEEHEHVYAHLLRHGGVVLLRGRGIVASRIIQRIHELRAHNPQIGILHLMRTPNPQGNRYGRAQRNVADHFEFQPFNWPKACWGGDLRAVLEAAPQSQRDQLLNDWGGTTTASRADWQKIVADGLREGWYQIEFGDVEKVERDQQQRKVITYIRGRGLVQNRIELPADYIIDATGLDAKVKSNPLLAELVDQYRLELNGKGRLMVANDFEVPGMRNGAGRMYAAGAITLGGPYAPVDSFLGLQFAAQQSIDALCALRAPGLRRLNGLRSLAQWLRWARRVQP
jgi:pSer/pThr/pTyr-binding forkhead associated (FHA) protein